MFQNKRHKMDPEASSTGTMEMPTFVQAGTAAPPIDLCKSSQDIFSEKSARFTEAVKWSGFVDKSLLIKELLLRKVPDTVIVFAPKRFGKSMNLDMVRTFFEVKKGRDTKEPPQNLEELKASANYKAFCRIGENGEKFGEKCKILNEEALVKEYFGKHPVLHLDFKNINVDSKYDVENDLRDIIHDKYVEHAYLAKGSLELESPTKTKVRQYNCEAWANPDKYKECYGMTNRFKLATNKGLEKLVEYLHDYYGRKVYLLVDEFDAPTVKALLRRKTGREVEAIADVVTSFLGSVVKGRTAQEYVLGGLITGVSYLGSSGISTYLNNITSYRFLQNERFVTYYGLTDDELQLLLDNVITGATNRKNDIKSEVIKLYNGYNYGGKNIYCLWSVLHYVRNSLFQRTSNFAFWSGSVLLKELAGILQNSSVIDYILMLMEGQLVEIEPVDKISVKDLAAILGNDMKMGDEFDPNLMDPNIFLTFLLEQGYLSTPLNLDLMASISVKIPNEEILRAYKSMFTYYHKKICGFADNDMVKCASVLKSMPSDASKGNGKLEAPLQELFEHLKALLKRFENLKGVKERSLQAVIYCAMLKANFQECILERCLRTDAGEGRIDLWMLRKDGFAVIWELKFDETKHDGKAGLTTKSSLDEILKGTSLKKVAYLKILEQRSITKYLLIGLSMSGDYEPTMCCLGNSTDPKECLFF